MTIDVYVIFVGVISIAGAVLAFYIARDESIFEKLKHTKPIQEIDFRSAEFNQFTTQIFIIQS
jgi:hypothetical protein